MFSVSGKYISAFFLSRPLLSYSVFGMWNFVLSMIPNFVNNKTKTAAYITWWNSSYPISTFYLVITGVIIHNLSYFDYLLYSAMIALIIGSICLFIIPSCTIYSLRRKIKKKLIAYILFRNE